MSNLTYLDFAIDELGYFTNAYTQGMRYNAMVGQAQRICECYLKHCITKTLFNNNEVMMQHNLRSLYEYMTDTLHLDLAPIRSDIMCLNNFYTHTRYPGKESFLASKEDVEASFHALENIVSYLQRYI